jgi:hypothetical protein
MVGIRAASPRNRVDFWGQRSAIYYTPLGPVCKSSVLTDTGFHAQTGDPANMKVCPRGTWNTRMLVETVLSMLTTVFHSKKMGYRVWAYFRARIAWTMAAFNLLARWSLEIDDENMVRLSIAEFSL